MTTFSSLITVNEDGEAIGTLQQFSCSFGLSMDNLLHVLKTTARDCVVFQAGSEPNCLLILNDGGVPALFSKSPMAHHSERDCLRDHFASFDEDEWELCSEPVEPAPWNFRVNAQSTL